MKQMMHNSTDEAGDCREQPHAKDKCTVTVTSSYKITKNTEERKKTLR